MDTEDNAQSTGKRKETLTQRLARRGREFHQWVKVVEPEELLDRTRYLEVQIYRFVLLLFAGIQRTELARRAASLTYTTILSIFPLLAVVTSIAAIFYTEEREQEFVVMLEKQLLPSAAGMAADPGDMTEQELELLQSQEEFAERMRNLFTEVSTSFRQSAGGVGVVGFVGLLLVGGFLYYSIESVVNQTWQTTHRGRWTRTFTNFITILVLAPIVIGLSVTSTTVATAFLDADAVPNAVLLEEEPPEDNEEAAREATPEVIEGAPEALQGALERVRIVTTRFGFLLLFIPITLNGLMLAVAYSFLPNVKVYFRYAIFGGLAAAVLWEVARYFFFYYVYMSFVNRTLADALGASVVFLIWIYITWMILLLGNLVVYTSQNLSQLWAERRSGEQLYLDGRVVVAAMVLLARRFTSQGGGLTEQDLRLALGLRSEQFVEMIDRLMEKGFVVALEDNAYQIARPSDQIALRDLLSLGCDLRSVPAARRSRGPVAELFGRVQEHTLNTGEDKTLADVIASVAARRASQREAAAGGRETATAT